MTADTAKTKTRSFRCTDSVIYCVVASCFNPATSFLYPGLACLAAGSEMAAEASKHHTLEDLPYDEEKAEPLRLELSLLKAITNNFSEEQVIGSGAYGVVYKALLGDNFIAVKLLGSFSEIEGKTFEREVDCLVRVKHRNIVGFVGYCAESHWEVVWLGAKAILAESPKRLLCFEYMCNGSLRRHLITGEPCGLQWHVCYQIVKGMCQGLHHLHEKHIIHLDLKPDNILLDDGMVPKIADFGLSRLLGVEKSRTVTQNIRGSMGYMAPEYMLHGSITIKSDIYSLGVIIMQMLIGGHMAEPIIENALGIWRCRLESETSQRHTPLEIGYQQVKACIEISTSCTEYKPENRPVTGDIIRRLGETVAGGISTSPESNQFRKDVSAQVPQHASHPVHFEAQSQNPPFKDLSRSDVLDASFSEAAEDDPLPGVDGLQIIGEAFPGRELQACGYSTNGTTSCNFEWVRHLDDGSVNFIEGASHYRYLVTADDVDTLLAVEVEPLDDRNRKAGEIVKVYANEKRKITCDPETKELIEKTLEIGHASYEVQLPVGFLDMWEPAVLAIKREGYSIKCNGQRGVVLTEKFQQATAINVVYGRPTAFSIISADGVKNYLKPAENTLPRDTIVLVLRSFRIMAVEKR